MSDAEREDVVNLVPAKKRPGRPRKKVDNISKEFDGIVDAPRSEDNILEMVYDNPRIFKKIFTLFRGYNSNEVLILFTKLGFTFITKGHLKKTTQLVKIRGHLLNRYYCKDDIKICVRCEELEKIFCSFDKTHYRITFVLKDCDYRSKLHIIVKDDEMDKIDHYEIDLIVGNVDLELVNYDDNNYPLKFVFPSRHFKTQIRDISTLCQSFSFQKVEDEQLAITYNVKNSVKYFSRYTNKEKLNLVSVLDIPIFVVTVKIALVKPFSNACIGDNVRIACDTKNPMCFTTELDEKKLENDTGETERSYVCEIKVYVEVSDEQ